MLGVFTSKLAVIICEVQDGEPVLEDYSFSDKKGGDGLNRDDFDFALVEGPVFIETNGMKVEPDRIMSGTC